MKITTFNPQIVTREAEPVVELFESLGFKGRHKQEEIGDLDVTGIRMKDANGFYLDISQSEYVPEKDLVAIRVNVDDFDEAYKILIDRGFKNLYGNKKVITKSSNSAMLISPSGFAINLIHHIK
jgi:hypothetical protein